jgi:acetylornithine deacetylase/succinyl-diaminopimelate desuccinylase-like protein
VVYAEWLGAAGQPTILIYAHYDVQPVSTKQQYTGGSASDIRGVM